MTYLVYGLLNVYKFTQACFCLCAMGLRAPIAKTATVGYESKQLKHFNVGKESKK